MLPFLLTNGPEYLETRAYNIICIRLGVVIYKKVGQTTWGDSGV